MAIKLWWAEQPQYPYEYKAVKELCRALEPLGETYFVFANYRVPNAQIDLTVFTETSIFLIELKSSAGKAIYGSLNGSWSREDGISLGSGNPIGQILEQYHRLRGWLNDNKRKFLSKNKAALLRDKRKAFNDIKKLVVLYPIKHPNSRIEVTDDRLRLPLGDVIGFDELVGLLKDPSWESRLGIQFEPEEIEQMAESLGLQRVALPLDATESLGEDRGVYEVGVKPEVPEKPARETRKPRLLWGTIIAVIIIGIVLFVLNHQRTRLTNSPEFIDVIQVEQHIGEIGRVRAYIDGVKLYPSDSPVYIMLFSGNFSVQVGPIDNPGDELRRYKRFKGHCVIIGPAFITRSGSGNPQIELRSERALDYIDDRGPGRCK